jgi:hypothetical protein
MQRHIDRIAIFRHCFRLQNIVRILTPRLILPDRCSNPICPRSQNGHLLHASAATVEWGAQQVHAGDQRVPGTARKQSLLLSASHTLLEMGFQKGNFISHPPEMLVLLPAESWHQQQRDAPCEQLERPECSPVPASFVE